MRKEEKKVRLSKGNLRSVNGSALRSNNSMESVKLDEPNMEVTVQNADSTPMSHHVQSIKF